MPTIKFWLYGAKNKLSEVGIPSAQLDSELILSHCLNRNRTYLHAHGDDEVNKTSIKKAEDLIKLRLKRTPIAYLLGYKFFYGRKFNVTKDTLIPRPESEDIIDIIKIIMTDTDNISNKIKLIDLGTGSGCLGITLKLELPNLDTTLIDINPNALKIANKNASKHKVDVKLIQSDLFDNYKDKADIIIANLPYVDRDWDTSPETKFEPASALFADDNGLKIIRTMINKSQNYTTLGSYMIIEADPIQHDYLINISVKNGFELKHKKDYILALKRII